MSLGMACSCLNSSCSLANLRSKLGSRSKTRFWTMLSLPSWAEHFVSSALSRVSSVLTTSVWVSSRLASCTGDEEYGDALFSGPGRGCGLDKDYWDATLVMFRRWEALAG